MLYKVYSETELDFLPASLKPFVESISSRLKLDHDGDPIREVRIVLSDRFDKKVNDREMLLAIHKAAFGHFLPQQPFHFPVILFEYSDGTSG